MIGKVLDASAVAALVRGSVSASAWFATMRTLSLPMYLPEVRAVRPEAGPQLAEVLGHPSVVLGELDAAAAGQVDQMLIDAQVFDGCAGHVVHIAQQRGWPALTADPGRLQRVSPALDVDLL